MQAPPENEKTPAVVDRGSSKNSNRGRSRNQCTVYRHPAANRRLPPFGKIVAKILRDPSQLSTMSGCTRDRATVWLLTGLYAHGRGASGYHRPGHNFHCG
jgi:hypothetical protein